MSSIRRAAAVVLLALAMLALLGGCGGGSSGGSSDEGGILFVTVDYPDVRGVVGTPLSATPMLDGIPQGATPRFVGSNLPSGLTVNASTGVISGTPTEVVTNRIATVTLTVSGYGGSIAASVYTNIIPTPLYSWSLASSTGPSLSKTDLVVFGNDLHAIGVGTTSNTIQTWRSSDGGQNWTNMNVAPAGALRHFAVASDGQAAYLTGGSQISNGANTNEVWRFDGSTWTQVVVASPFPARRRHAMVFMGGSLYVIGGVADNGVVHATDEGTTGYLNDVWRSSDGGANWTRMTSAAAFAPRFAHCALTRGGRLYVVGGYYGGRDREVYESVDGVNWSLVGRIADAFNTHSALSGCIVHNGKLITLDGAVFGADGPGGLLKPRSPERAMYYSDDGATWTFESPRVAGAPSSRNFTERYGHGIAVVGTRLVVVGGVGSFTSATEVWTTQ